ncbi:hypothetical protein WAF17_08805 [Bernardetia sp. ABR2-2B]|uniref:hypothetical protein n=1 Tax=Bernardetia sp. ABR2-2B TaxID=3127472 RepID=UPI0030CB4C7A
MKTKLIKFHFIILLILVVNFIITLSFDIGLNNYIKIGLKILLYGSALVGSVAFFKPFKFVTAYFSLYVISPLLIFLAWLADGIFGAILASVFVGIFYTSTPVYKQDNYEIHSAFKGFMGNCCRYEVYKNNFLFSKNTSTFAYTEYTTINGEKVEELAPFLDGSKIKNIKIENDSIFIEFKDNSSRSFELD